MEYMYIINGQLICRAGLLSGRSESLLGQFEAGSVGPKKKKEVYFCTKLAPFPWRIG